jgi:transcriptional regulator with XRE-family HTH domain/mannose-6-phosphate isomerase-like protein (cupin superfamily)
MTPEETQSLLTIGNRMRRVRLQQELSIRNLATAAGVSKTSIVRLEAGEQVRHSTLLKVAAVLGVHIDRISSPVADTAATFAVHRHEDDAWYDLTSFADTKIDCSLSSTPAKRKRLAKSQGIVPLNILSSRLDDGRIKPTIIELYDASPVRGHIGEEFVMVLEGTALISIGESKIILHEGESVTFWSAEPHGYSPAPRAKLPVRILSVRVDTA